jgi:hypothetical protein
LLSVPVKLNVAAALFLVLAGCSVIRVSGAAVSAGAAMAKGDRLCAVPHTSPELELPVVTSVHAPFS